MIYGFYKKSPVRSKPYWDYLLETFDPRRPKSDLVPLTEKLINALSQCKGKQWIQHNPQYNALKLAFIVNGREFLYPKSVKADTGEWINPDEKSVNRIRELFKLAWSKAVRKERSILWLTDDFEPVYVWSITTNSAKRKFNYVIRSTSQT